MSIELTFGGSDKALLERIRAKGAQIVRSVLREMDIDMLKLQAHIVRDKLSGQVLKRGPNTPGHSGGTLAASIRKGETELVGTEIVGQVLGAGGDAWYGRLHEFGTTSSYEIVAINKKALRFFIDGRAIIRRSVMHPPIKERSFMRSSLEDMRSQIIEDLQNAAARGLNE